MLRKYRPRATGLIGLMAILTALAVCAFGASGASALPELLWCMPSATGKYSSQENCEKLIEGGSGWEWEDETLAGETFELMFTSGKGLLEAVAGTVHIECETDKGGFTVVTLEGGIQFFKTGDVTFEKCFSLFGTKPPCNSPGQASGVILTVPLLASLRYLKAGKALPVGILIEPETPPTFVTIECGSLKGTVEGAIIGEVTKPINEEATTGTVIFGLEAGHQKWRKIEEEAAKFELKAFGESNALLESTETLEVLVNGVTSTATIDA
jgi:hypothetical protein